jgi:hypothetical protein
MSGILHNYFPHGIPIFYMNDIAFHPGELCVGIRKGACDIIIGDNDGIIMDVEYSGRVGNELCYYGTEKVGNKLLAAHIGIRPMNYVTKKVYRKNILGMYRHRDVVRVAYTLSYSDIVSDDTTRSSSFSEDIHTSDSMSQIPGFTIISACEYIMSLKVRKWRFLAAKIAPCFGHYTSNENDYKMQAISRGSVIKNLNKIRKESSKIKQH